MANLSQLGCPQPHHLVALVDGDAPPDADRHDAHLQVRRRFVDRLLGKQVAAAGSVEQRFMQADIPVPNDQGSVGDDKFVSRTSGGCSATPHT
jgi:hypothetical protein